MPFVVCYNPACRYNDKSDFDSISEKIVGGICKKTTIEIMSALKLCQDFDDSSANTKIEEADRLQNR